VNQLEQVFYFEENPVRSVMVEGEPWFVAKDVCRILELGDTRQVIERLEKDEWYLIPVVDSMGRKQKTYIVNEFGLYSLILGSRKKEARIFKRWVTHEVLPRVIKTGTYGGAGWPEYKAALKESLRENEDLLLENRELRELVEQYEGIFSDGKEVLFKVAGLLSSRAFKKREELENKRWLRVTSYKRDGLVVQSLKENKG